MFEYFKDTEIDLSEYLKSNNIKLRGIQPTKTTMKELLSFSNIIDNINPEWLYEYVIKDEYRVDLLSNKIYNDEQYWWIILLINGIENPFKWVLNPSMLDLLCEELYNTNAQNFSSKEVVFQLVNEWNDKQRNIFLLKSSALIEFKKLIKDSLGR